MGELRALQKRLGITSLYVTHDQSEAMAISDRVVIMKDGNIMQQGTPTEIYEQPNSRFVANFIGKENFIDGVFKGRDGEAALVEINGHIFSIPAPGVMPSASVLILNSGLDIIAAERLLYLCMSPLQGDAQKIKIYIITALCA